MRQPMPIILLVLLGVVLLGAAGLQALHRSALKRQAAQARAYAASHPPPDPPRWSPPPVTADARLVSASNAFGLRLLQTVSQRSPERNAILSPVSLFLALAMVYNGAGGQTRTEMAHALSLGDLQLGSLNLGCLGLRSALPAVGGQPVLDLANSLWIDNSLSVKPLFADTCRRFYFCGVQNLKLEATTALPLMNNWVSQWTRGRITQIVTPEDFNRSGPLLVALLNTVYFKGFWTQPFEPELTEEGDFYPATGGSRRVPLMGNKDFYFYREDNTLQAIALPYADGRYSLYVLLPRERYGLRSLLQTLTPQVWDASLGAMQYREGTIRLPRFTLDFNRDLNDDLAVLGMGRAFVPEQADFSGLADGALWLDKVRQRVWLQVNERGTEAAVATYVGGAGGPPPPPPPDPFHMIVDHPFLLAIRDNASGILLFLGAVQDVEGAE